MNKFNPEQMQQMLHDLFCGMVARKLEEHGLILGLDGDSRLFATSLDMSFEEIMAESLSDWEAIIERDVVEYKNSTNC